MFKCLLFLTVLFGNAEKKQSDTIIKWSRNHRLDYDDFRGKHDAGERIGSVGVKDSVIADTFAVISCFIKYDLKFVSGKRSVHAYGAADPQKSWIDVKDPQILRHEQGHFDITEIYARKFQQIMNKTTIPDLHNYFVFLTDTYNATMTDLLAEQNKYDAWVRNTFGKEYYYKWINEQLFQAKDASGDSTWNGN